MKYFVSLVLSLLLSNCFVYADTSSSPPIILNSQSIYYISSNNVRVRSTPDNNSKIIGELALNDLVKVINPTTIYNDKFIQIIITKSREKIDVSDKYFISKDFLSEKEIDYKEFKGKYFVIVNVATETLRLYERMCDDNSCPSKMIMQSEVVVGEDLDHPKEDKGKGRSILGSYRLTGWAKFYEDPEKHYPAWYRDGYPDTPAPGSSWTKWFSSKSMPLGADGKSEGVMRGAFGWYTAFVGPQSYGQWTHGTLGWGSDKDKYIKKVKHLLINVVSDPRSSGCTRNNNEAIAYLRYMLEIGTPIIKIYAIEDILDPTFKNYSETPVLWNYVLTKNKSHAIDRDAVIKNLKVDPKELDDWWEAKKSGGSLVLNPDDALNQILEVGTYQLDNFPQAIKYKRNMFNILRKLKRKGNIYGLKLADMHGVFYVDAGILHDYAHPSKKLEVGGFPDEVTPPWMRFENLKK